MPVNKKISMQKEKNHIEELNKTLAAVCGLYCEACSLFIGTNEDPARLLRIAKQFQSEMPQRNSGSDFETVDKA